ncbi:MAG: glutathione S-transferase family protein [Rubrivivax sp.]|nr:MAG: glutathione S-transferase family protein [Rubrivivax sp.]
MPTPSPFTLISHPLCPYVQRAAIVLLEKGVPFERRDIDLAHKPDWFLRLSPMGKTPVLLVDQQPIFESAVICEYLDDTLLPRLHPADALARARHRAWIEFGSSVLATIWAFYTAKDEATLQAKASEIRARFEQVEAALGEGPYFAGGEFSIVDAVFGPVLRYFDVFDKLGDFGFFQAVPKVQAWRVQLAARPSVQQAVRPDYADLLTDFLKAHDSALAASLRL